MTRIVKQFSLASAIYFSLMGIYMASQAIGFHPAATLAALGK